jgi:hypothetical protein
MATGILIGIDEKSILLADQDLFFQGPKPCSCRLESNMVGATGRECQIGGGVIDVGCWATTRMLGDHDSADNIGDRANIVSWGWACEA